MQLWTNFVDWLSSDDGGRIVSTIIVPFVAIIIAGVIAAAVGRGSTKRMIALSDRETKASAVTALIGAARKAAVWNTISAPEQAHVEHLIGEADIRLRLLPMAGTALAADWARHEILDMQKNAVSFSFQAEQSLLTFRDRLIEWQSHPSRAKRLFKNDLDSWAYDSTLSDQELIAQQQAWAAQQQTEAGSLDAYAAPDPATKSEPQKTEALVHAPAEHAPAERATTDADTSAFSPVTAGATAKRASPLDQPVTPRAN
ncbi:hypothetical protein [Lacisediminihabitans changchengi]|uniref:Uncharacterized protein n=1 Tax=Lacisediminihabitans changchengi TaxID=2787634 RepID=A0A934SNE6_9MICO|nr:hypothetical protein [Lacisediminihabitans changchengi]MBK4346055.1 hypothetical protein [Lacisediminihabitans changchengi]